MWVAHVSLMNVLWSLHLNQWTSRILEFFEWLEWKIIKDKTYHIFPFTYGL